MNFETAGYPLLPILPELVLVVGAMLLLMLGAYRGPKATGTVTVLAILLLLATGALELFALPAGKLVTFGGSFIVDDFARFLKVLALIGSAVTLILSLEVLTDPSRRMFEYAILVLLSSAGMLLLISAGDLIMLYLGLELMSLALYVVAASNRQDAKSNEAGMKYFVLGALSSGMLLYGASLIYGFTGTVQFSGIAAAAKDGNVGLVFGLVFLLAGLCFKVSAVPFHMLRQRRIAAAGHDQVARLRDAAIGRTPRHRGPVRTGAADARAGNPRPHRTDAGLRRRTRRRSRRRAERRPGTGLNGARTTDYLSRA